MALLAAGGAAFLVFGGGGGAGHRSAGHRGAHHLPTRSQELRRIRRAAAKLTIVEAGLAPGFGWAMNGLALWVTPTPQGHWRPITPPHVHAAGDVVARIDQIDFADRDHGWITASDIPGSSASGAVVAGGSRHFEIQRTSDGGRHWAATVPPGCAACGRASVSFVDARHGFLLATLQLAPRLYASTNGGSSWRLISRPPFDGRIVFVNRTDGFAASGARLYATRDAGLRWHAVSLAAPSRYAADGRAVGVPVFFGGSGVLPVRFRARGTRAQHLVVYVSSDRGRSWTGRPAPHGADLRAYTWSSDAGIPFAAADARNWKLLVGPIVFSTADAGRTWTRSRARYAPNAPAIWDVQFSSPSSGRAIFGVGGGAALVETANGGRDWAPLSP